MPVPLDIRALRDTFVRPFYLGLLHGNFRRPAEDQGVALREAIITSANEISDDQIACLLTEREWRGAFAQGGS
jgi:hypothetical protein